MAGRYIKVIRVIAGIRASSKRCCPEGTYRSRDLLRRCGKESLSLHDDVHEIVNSPRHSDGQGYVRPNNAGVRVQEGVGVRQVCVQ